MKRIKRMDRRIRKRRIHKIRLFQEHELNTQIKRCTRYVEVGGEQETQKEGKGKTEIQRIPFPRRVLIKLKTAVYMLDRTVTNRTQSRLYSKQSASLTN